MSTWKRREKRALERILEDTKVLGQAEEKQPTIECKKKSSERWENQRKVILLITERREWPPCEWDWQDGYYGHLAVWGSLESWFIGVWRKLGKKDGSYGWPWACMSATFKREAWVRVSWDHLMLTLRTSTKAKSQSWQGRLLPLNADFSV